LKRRIVTFIFGYADYYARAQFGNLGIAYDAAALCSIPDYCNESLSNGFMAVNSTDPIYVSGGSDADFLKLDLLLDGGVTNMGGISPNLASVTYSMISFGSVNYSAGAACSNQVSCGSGTSGLQIILVPLHPVEGIVYTLLSQNLEFQFDCTASRDIQCLQSGDFLHSALVGNATIVNADGQVVSGSSNNVWIRLRLQPTDIKWRSSRTCNDCSCSARFIYSRF
jgi:hypothetical protein